MVRTRTLLAALMLGGCGAILPRPPETSSAHLRADRDRPAKSQRQIPRILEQVPFLPPPVPQFGRSLETYTVVVNEVPVRELLFALARDAALNVDIHPGIEGRITVNAVDQTLPQILDRVSRQVDLRYELRDSDLIVMPDLPYLRIYKIDYVNIARDTKITNTMATQIASTGTSLDGGGLGSGLGGGGGEGGGNFSSSDVSAVSNHRLWTTLTTNILAIIGDGQAGSAEGGIPVTANVIPNPESGTINVRASSRQHEEIRKFIDTVLGNAKRQVLIEATVVDVTLNDTHQAGVDWSFLSGEEGFNISSVPTAIFGVPPTEQTFIGEFFDPHGDKIRVTVQALERFGDVKVLSSPRLMVLNNQTALLKVARNVVYFEINQSVNQVQGAQSQTLTTTVHTVPVGFMMTVTPQINENGIITLNVRPTISRLFRFVQDPAPQIIGGPDTPAVNRVPEIEVREVESMLRLRHGQIGLLGGLMQDNVSLDTEGVPVLSRIPGIGNAFKARDNRYEKNELVIFLRPVVVEDPSVDTDLANYRPYLEDELSDKPHSIYHDY